MKFLSVELESDMIVTYTEKAHLIRSEHTDGTVFWLPSRFVEVVGDTVYIKGVPEHFEFKLLPEDRGSTDEDYGEYSLEDMFPTRSFD